MTKNTKHKKEKSQQLRDDGIKKSLNRRIGELLDSLQVIRDALSGLRAGRTYQLIPLSGQLRALLTEKRKDNKPLLLDLAEIMDGELIVYAMPDTEKSDIPVKDGLQFRCLF